MNETCSSSCLLLSTASLAKNGTVSIVPLLTNVVKPKSHDLISLLTINEKSVRFGIEWGIVEEEKAKRLGKSHSEKIQRVNSIETLFACSIVTPCSEKEEEEV